MFVALPTTRFQYQILCIRCAGSIGFYSILPHFKTLGKSQRKKLISTLLTALFQPSARKAAATRSTAMIDAARIAISSRATCKLLIPLQRTDESWRVGEQSRVVQHLRYAVVPKMVSCSIPRGKRVCGSASGGGGGERSPSFCTQNRGTSPEEY